MSSADRGPEGRERRRTSGDFRVRPRPSPVNVLVLGIAAALIATAGASLVWGGFNEATPHGRLLDTLHQIATAQEVYWSRAGRFAPGLEPLRIASPGGVVVRVTRGDATGWEAMVSDPKVGLGCRQEGSVGGSGRPERGEPVCFTYGARPGGAGPTRR